MGEAQHMMSRAHLAQLTSAALVQTNPEVGKGKVGRAKPAGLIIHPTCTTKQRVAERSSRVGDSKPRAGIKIGWGVWGADAPHTHPVQ